jgi:signal peptide peptidase SppA
MEGIIASGRAGFRSSQLNMRTLAAPLERAFKVSDVVAVVLLINSPGGSPVQSSLIAKRVRALAEENEIPVVAFAEDVAASGGYWLACAADEIYADASSILGSIGVISAGFGFQDFIQRYGVERRVYAAGDHKGALDPFQPENPDDVARLKTAQAAIHESFKEMVRSRRAGKISAPEDEVFSGEFWTGTQAQELGLVDGIGDVRAVMRERYGDKVRFVMVSPKRNWLRDRFGVGDSYAPGRFAGGDAWVGAAIGAIEDRLTWSRFGL